jgi:hypothetical protein
MTTLPVSYRLLLVGLVPEDFDLLRPHLEPVLADTSPLEAMVQMPGSALRMPANAFRQQARRSTDFSRLLLRDVQVLHVQVSLSAACNDRHRCRSTWLGC